jgi:fatty acid amide hydrolase
MTLWKKTAVEQADLLARGEVSSVELTKAHLDRIDAADRSLHAFVTVLREEALASAEKADRARAAGQTGRLLGLPMTIKESINMQGHASTMGVASRVANRATEDAVLVAMVRERGAVILGRTNISQLNLYHEARNPLFGRTSNPFRLTHGPGGSSGGESAAIAGGLSPMGIGGDIGGSVRVPAHFTGICGLKPSLDLWSNSGSNTALVGQEVIRGQTGPLARTVADVAMLFRALDPVSASRRDPRVPPLDLEASRAALAGPCRIGLVDDGSGVLLAPSPALRRALRRAAEALRAAGHEIVPVKLPDAEDMVLSYFAALSADAGDSIGPILEGGEVDPVLAALRRTARLPDAARKTIVHLARLAGDPAAAALVASLGRKSVAELWKLTDKIRRYRTSLLSFLASQNLDALLTPPFATPALPHGKSQDFAVAGGFSMLFNLTQLPAGSVPVLRVRAEETVRAAAKGRFAKMAAAVDEASLGLPVGVQIVGKPWEDERVLSLMAAVEAAVSSDPDFPVTPVEHFG